MMSGITSQYIFNAMAGQTASFAPNGDNCSVSDAENMAEFYASGLYACCESLKKDFVVATSFAQVALSNDKSDIRGTADSLMAFVADRADVFGPYCNELNITRPWAPGAGAIGFLHRLEDPLELRRVRSYAHTYGNLDGVSFDNPGLRTEPARRRGYEQLHHPVAFEHLQAQDNQIKDERCCHAPPCRYSPASCKSTFGKRYFM
ncbi:hypothetical protein VTI74DRAFT_9904 [Chaetomium olivicolor]